MAAFYFRKSFFGSVAMALASMNATAQSALDQWGDARLNICSEELRESGDFKTLSKAVRKELRAEDTLGVYLSPAVKPLLRDARVNVADLDTAELSDLERYEDTGIMSPESSLKILKRENVIRSYDLQLKDGNVHVWPAVSTGGHRARLTLEPMLSVPASKLDPALVSAMENRAPSLSVVGGKRAASDLNAQRNSQGIYEFGASGDGKLRDLGRLDEFFDRTLDGFCAHRASRSSWARNRSSVNEQKKSASSAQHAD